MKPLKLKAKAAWSTLGTLCVNHY